MPNKKSAKKRVLTNKKAEVRNKAAKSTMRTAIKSTNGAIAAGEAGVADQVKTTQALIARTAKRGVIHDNKAARLQSRLMKRVQRAAAEK